MRNTAGVTRQQNGGDTWDQLVIRGVEVQNRTNYRLNGSMPIMNFSQVPMENKARVEVLKGASALYYGFTAPSGIVNYVTKRAGLHPVTSVGLRFDTNGTLLAHADVGPAASWATTWMAWTKATAASPRPPSTGV